MRLVSSKSVFCAKLQIKVELRVGFELFSGNTHCVLAGLELPKKIAVNLINL